MAWEWQVWRSFDDIRETFEEKGWGSGFVGREGNGAMPPLLAECGDHCVAFFKRDPSTGECWFQLRDRLRRRMVFVHGTHNIPTPQGAAELLANHGGPLHEVSATAERPIYGLPVAPMMPATKS